MLFYSHVWDLVLKLSSLTFVVILAVQLNAEASLQRVGVPADLLVPVLIGGIVVGWMIAYRQGLSTIAAWLYATVNLGASVSLHEARQLTRLFQLDLSLQWVPLKEIRQIPKPQRRNALLAALNTLRARRKTMLF